jgi:preprotein translocase subunit SecA
MIGALARRLFGSSNDRYVKALQKDVDAINALEPTLEALSDEELRERTAWLRMRLTDGETLDKILVDAFATVREASKRTLGQRHFDVQLMGGSILHRGMIAEMKTGEGKTLVSTLPVYLNAIGGKGVHVVTVNDYLAQRDAAWMGEIYNFLGLSVGCIVHGLDDEERQANYGADVTYGTNNELGFDYLRDNMKFRLEEMVQRDFNFAIIDEVDSILIDEARTPLIISGQAEGSSDLYGLVDALIPSLEPEHFEKEEKHRSCTFTEAGIERIEELMRDAGILTEGQLFDISNIALIHHADQALKAHKLFTRDVDYIVKDDKAIIIDEFTGRMMEGRRYSDGLHQAIEAKEHVTVENENQTLASITFQNYFRLYPKLAGMTGTAMTEAGEFSEIYKLESVEIPTNLNCIRIDQDDEVYRTEAEKYDAIVNEIEEFQKRGQPILVGTVSIEKSELLATLLTKKAIKHQVLNARYHEQEAHIIAQAGASEAVTIATNMAGRGTDIQLGGNPEMLAQNKYGDIKDDTERDRLSAELTAEVAEDKKKVIAAGGLFIMGTERHESRRIDNQLRGRSGRQGDPGASKFYLSLEDDLMRIFGSERIDSMLQRLGLQEGEAIVHPWVNKALEKAQEKVEERNFEIRKNLLKYDDVMNDQRKVIYEQRKDLMAAEEVTATIIDMRQSTIDEIVSRCIPEKAYPEQWDTGALHEEVLRIFGLDQPVADWAKEEGIADAEIRSRLIDVTDRKAAEKVANYGADVIRSVEKSLLLQILDQLWKEHLFTLDHLRHGIGLRAYAQRDPLNEFKREAFDLFEEMLANLRERVTSVLSHIELQFSLDEGLDLEPRQDSSNYIETREDPAFGDGEGLSDGAAEAPVRLRQKGAQIDPEDSSTWGRVSRNATCPCESGKKYKHCHGKVA